MKGFIRGISTLLGMALMLGTTTGCSRPPAPPPAAPGVVKLSAQEVENLRYVRENSSVSIPHRLNLAEEHQYRYVLATLKRAGRSPETSPQLYKEIERARQAGTAGPPAMMTTADAAAGESLGGVNYTSEFGQETDQSFSTTSYSTYPQTQIPYSTQMVVTLIDTQNNATISTNSHTAHSTTNVAVTTAGASPGTGIPVESNALFLIAPSNGSPLQPFSVILTASTAITAPCQTSPAYNTTGVQQCQTNSNTTCVNSGPVSTALQVCYGNRIQRDCDYGCTGTSYPPNVIFPISGSVNLGQTPASPLSGSLYIVLTDTTGGGCVLKATQNTAGSLAGLITMNGNVASWNFAPGNFPNNGNPPCLQTNGMVFNYLFQLFAQTSGGFAGATFTSDTTQAGLPDTVIVPQIDVIAGCLPAGTAIRTADGKTKAIEAFQGYGDEKVRSQSGDRAVSAVTWGSEEKPLVSIRDDKGHALLLTEAHPVITNRGVVMASALKQGDVVQTEAGPAALVEVSRKTSAQPVPVHNLRVGSQEEAAKGANTFYANGILVGDQLMQRHGMLEASRPRQLSKEEILATLPKEWHQDYLNSLAAPKPPKP